MNNNPQLPWWKVRLMWIVIGGPLAVVVAALVTAVIAVRGADPVLSAKPAAGVTGQPAMQARNHAAAAKPQ